MRVGRQTAAGNRVWSLQQGRPLLATVQQEMKYQPAPPACQVCACLFAHPSAGFSNAVTFSDSPPAAAVGARYQANLTFVAPSELCTAQVGPVFCLALVAAAHAHACSFATQLCSLAA